MVLSTMLKKCLICNKVIPINTRDSIKVRENRKFCSSECNNKRSGRLAGNYKGGVTKKCLTCERSFTIDLNEANKGMGKYCSRKCHYWNKSKGNRPLLKCVRCGKEFYKSPSAVFKTNFCSRKCQHRPEGYKYKNRGYIKVKQSKHPNSISGYILEHRLVMEKKIGRYLVRGEVVHHINRIKDDNREDNLMLFACDKDHQDYHNKYGRNERKNKSRS